MQLKIKIKKYNQVSQRQTMYIKWKKENTLKDHIQKKKK